VVGIIGIMFSYAIFVNSGEMTYPLVVVTMGIIALVSPDVIDQLPLGPNK